MIGGGGGLKKARLLTESKNNHHQPVQIVGEQMVVEIALKATLLAWLNVHDRIFVAVSFDSLPQFV